MVAFARREGEGGAGGEGGRLTLPQAPEPLWTLVVHDRWGCGGGGHAAASDQFLNILRNF